MSPNFSSAKDKRPIDIFDSKFAAVHSFNWTGALTTIIKSWSALGPSFKVIFLVSSLDTGFSIDHDSY